MLWVVGGFVARRSPSAKSKAVAKADGTKSLPAKTRSASAKPAKTAPPVDDDMAEIEALLKSRGIE